MQYSYTTSQAPDKGVQVGPEPIPTPNATLAMTQDNIPGFGGNLIEVGIITNGTNRAVYMSKAYPANADGKQRPGAVVEYSSEFSVGEGIGGVEITIPEVLPAGYLAAEFIEFTGNTVIRISIPVNNSLGLYFDYEKTLPIATNDFPISWQRSSPYRAFRLVCGETSGGFNWWGTSLAYKTPAGYRTLWQANFKNNRIISVNSAEYGYAEKSLPDIDCNYDEVGFGRLFLLDSKLFGERAYFKSYSIKLSSGSKVVNDLIPAIAPTGEPCMYDKVTRKPFCNSGSGSFIVGMTLEQAQNLGKLPAGGGTLTVSLPSNYLEDEGVVNALETARTNGWTLTIQTYAVDTAMTIDLLDVWVRKTQDENGSYVDAEGVRWQVEWCVDIVGADPEQEGYEMFRSVEAATEYWGLTPYVDPEAEEEFSQEL